MPELPDIELYLRALAPRVVGEPLDKVRLKSAFLLRSVAPPLGAAEGRRVTGLRRLGKRIVFALEGELFLVLHLMIAGRLRWRKRGAGLPGRMGLAAFDFPGGTLLLTEASKKKRASLHVVAGTDELARHDPRGLEVLESDLAAFATRLRSRNHTLKRALTDPRLFSGIGNAYSDEILHRARLSPFKLTGKIGDQEVEALFDAARGILTEWTERLAAEVGDGFPEKVTAFREGMAVHGRYRQPCPVCGAPVQRVVYAANEANYCAGCQTGGRVLADRALSRLLKDDWPRTLEELEERLPGADTISYDSPDMAEEARGMIRTLLGSYGAKLRFPQLFTIAASLFFVDLLIPDLIPFIDEILLGLLTLLLGSMQNKPAVPEDEKPPVKDVTPPGGD